MPARRPGRKRRQGVERNKSGRIIAAGKAAFTATYMEGEYMDAIVEVPESAKATHNVTRKTVLEAMGVSGGLLEAGKELEKLWHLCRRYATSAPPISAKAASLHRGYGHEPLEQTAEQADFGAYCHAKYQGAIRKMAQNKYVTGVNTQAYAHSVIRSVIAACIENKPLTVDGEYLCKQGLRVLADHWNY